MERSDLQPSDPVQSDFSKKKKNSKIVSLKNLRMKKIDSLRVYADFTENLTDECSHNR